MRLAQAIGLFTVSICLSLSCAQAQEKPNFGKKWQIAYQSDQNTCVADAYLGRSVFVTLNVGRGELTIDIQDNRNVFDFKPYDVVVKGEPGLHETTQIKPISDHKLHILLLVDEAKLTPVRNMTVALGDHSYTFDTPDFSALKANAADCGHIVKNLDQITPASGSADVAVPAEPAPAPVPVVAATPSPAPKIEKAPVVLQPQADVKPAPLLAPAAAPAVVPAVETKAAQPNPLPPTPVQAALKLQQAQAPKAPDALPNLPEVSVTPVNAVAPAQPDVAPVVSSIEDQNCISQERYDNLVRKIGLLESEKEKLRQKAMASDVSTPLQPILQCAAERNLARDLQAEIDILRKENEALQKRVHESQSANSENLDDALSELDQILAK